MTPGKWRFTRKWLAPVSKPLLALGKKSLTAH